MLRREIANFGDILYFSDPDFIDIDAFPKVLQKIDLSANVDKIKLTGMNSAGTTL